MVFIILGKGMDRMRIETKIRMRITMRIRVTTLGYDT
jgi:hypothetical protein